MIRAFKIALAFVIILSNNVIGQQRISNSDMESINRCDSLLVAHFKELDHFTADTSKLNVYKYSKDSIPRVTDAEIIKRIGKQGEVDNEIHAILEEYSLPYKFSKENIKEAEELAKEINYGN